MAERPHNTNAPDTMPEIEALAAQFEAAWKDERELGDETDEATDAAVARVRKIARKIAALKGLDLAILRLKARAYLWAENETFESLVENASDYSAEAMLVSLFRDLGAGRAS
jgi:hypothetical protein